ncbi:MAG TPA: phosphoribosylanthranilate isomerase [Pyrinomonadaceae bacterium]|nr:phosphoribosylanthranilate isomerase [Pyrinomonadaceae bacterium]
MTKVKICGITNPDDARRAADLGADMLGFNFFEGSSRYLAPSAAYGIGGVIPAGILKVGVFVNARSQSISEIVAFAGLDAVQLHGDEDAAFIRELRNETGAKVIKAFRVGPNPANFPVGKFDADFILLDTFSADAYGGTGNAFDWKIATEVWDMPANGFLAGGLTPENVNAAIEIARPFAVDVASGVESSPGIKDPRKLEAFISIAKKT